ncbi:hypothetical protein MHY87_01575 [Microvirga sp. ACRRW]|uniref:hypothetical protein n=1 Tax=Microvirga sp. ACRRW TaxID=2918205 RepID=UPI001EF4FA45|nr:hypothetical protein [Microvirga sp. ACRRW]MCG7391598.1 hypothetical protein [Microvirga sp. ACRRW]
MADDFPVQQQHREQTIALYGLYLITIDRKAQSCAMTGSNPYELSFANPLL